MSRLLCKLKSCTFLLFLVYIVMFCLMCGIAVYLSITSNNDVYTSAGKYVAFDFYTESGELVTDPFQLHKYEDNSYIYTIIPKNLNRGFDFCFESKHMNAVVYIDDQLIYDCKNDDNKLYTDSNGFRFVTIPLEKTDCGKVLKIKYDLFYKDDINCGIYKAAYCSSDNYIVLAFKEDFLALCLSSCCLIYGIILVILDTIFYKILKYEKDFKYLGFLMLSVGLYSIFDIRSLYLYINNSQLIHLLKCMSLILVPSSMMLYASSVFNNKRKKIFAIFAVYNLFTFIAMTILNMNNIIDYHELSVWPIFNMALALGLMVYTLWCKYKCMSGKTFKLSNLSYDYKMVFIGCIFCTVLVTMDMIYFGKLGTIDNTYYTRYGFFVLSICFSIVSIRKFIESVKLRTRMSIISNLAYKDGLTDLYNRTSYREDLEQFEKNGQSVGIVMLDINNLKHVNDTYGHDEGDDMLLSCAKILKRAYNKPNMKVYRIGGDEFVVIIDSIDSVVDYNYCDDRMKRLYQEFNVNTDKRFKIVISSGFCQYSVSEHSSIEDAVKDADSKMYECKKALKQYRYFNIMV